MKKFIVTYHSTPAAMSRWANASAEQKEEGMKPWMAWSAQMGEHLVEMGSPLMNGTQIGTNGNHAPSTRQITGYSIMQAQDLEQAQALLANHPHSMAEGNAVEVHESVPM